MALYVTDTHALIWYATGNQKRLGPAARRAFTQAERGRAAIYVPALVLVELLENAGHAFHLLPSTAEWVRQVFASASFHFVDLTRDVILTAQQLGHIAERGDRLIAATAVSLDAPLLTRDPGITGVRTLW